MHQYKQKKPPVYTTASSMVGTFPAMTTRDALRRALRYWERERFGSRRAQNFHFDQLQF